MQPTPAPTQIDPGTACCVKMGNYCPGNGTRYLIVAGHVDGDKDWPFVALPAFGKSAIMSLTPGTWQYVQEKLHLNDPDAEIVRAWLNDEEPEAWAVRR